MQRSFLAIGCSLSLLACGGPLTDLDDLEWDGVVGAESENVGKADRPDISFTVIQNFELPSSHGQTETRRLFTSAESFRRYFGVSAPFRFTNRWAIFFSAGVQRSGGYRAAVMRVRTTDSGLTLKVTTRKQTPGSDCVVTMALTKPWILITIPRPSGPAPRYVRYYRDDVTQNCSEVSCRTARCAPGHMCIDDSAGVRCERYATCATAEMACAPGFHCEDRSIVCVRAPCAPTAPTCVEDEVTSACARVRCARNTFCSEESGNARCNAYRTCDSERLSCAAGQHCEDRPIVCVRAPCPPTAPSCVDDN